jgi:hypothetical protein
MKEHHDEMGRLRMQWNDDAERFYAWDEEGNLIEDRAYNDQEIAEAAVRQEEQQTLNNRATLEEQVRTRLVAALSRQAYLRDNLATSSNTAINGNPAPYIKAVGNMLMETNADLIRLVRLIGGQLDSTDAGETR